MGCNCEDHGLGGATVHTTAWCRVKPPPRRASSTVLSKRAGRGEGRWRRVSSCRGHRRLTEGAEAGGGWRSAIFRNFSPVLNFPQFPAIFRNCFLLVRLACLWVRYVSPVHKCRCSLRVGYGTTMFPQFPRNFLQSDATLPDRNPPPPPPGRGVEGMGFLGRCQVLRGDSHLLTKLPCKTTPNGCWLCCWWSTTHGC